MVNNMHLKKLFAITLAAAGDTVAILSREEEPVSRIWQDVFDNGEVVCRRSFPLFFRPL